MIRGFDMPWMLACWECANTAQLDLFHWIQFFSKLEALPWKSWLLKTDPVIGKAVQQGISEAGHQLLVKDSRHGFEQTMSQRFDVIILDLMIPGRTRAWCSWSQTTSGCGAADQPAAGISVRVTAVVHYVRDSTGFDAGTASSALSRRSVSLPSSDVRRAGGHLDGVDFNDPEFFPEWSSCLAYWVGNGRRWISVRS